MAPSSLPSQLFSVDTHTEASRRDDRIFTQDLDIVFPGIVYRGIRYHQAIINLLTGVCEFYRRDPQSNTDVLINKMAVKIELFPINSQPVKFDEPT